jgi:hypothetical protein
MARFFARSYIGLRAPIAVTPADEDQTDLDEVFGSPNA